MARREPAEAGHAEGQPPAGGENSAAHHLPEHLRHFLGAVLPRAHRGPRQFSQARATRPSGDNVKKPFYSSSLTLQQYKLVYLSMQVFF